MRSGSEPRPVRYAVVGAGHISQVALLPGFDSAHNSELVAIVSGDPDKRQALGARYDVPTYDYDDYDDLLERDEVDAVYIGLPNHLHCDYTVRAAQRGVHVLCEKPMAVDEVECEHMIRAAEDGGAKLMIAYRLHLEPAHLQAIERASNGELGELRYLSSTFTQDVKAGNVRLMPTEQGGGPLYDMGVYCINVARYLLRDEPEQVTAVQCSRQGDPRFSDSPEMISVILRFPHDRIATFLTGFGSASVSRLTLAGDRGSLTMEPAYSYAQPIEWRLSTEDRDEPERYEFGKHDQFGAQLAYFSRCIHDDEDPEPDGLEGLADVHIIRRAHESAREGKPLPLLPLRQRRRPVPEQAVVRPGIEPPEEIHASSPSSR